MAKNSLEDALKKITNRINDKFQKDTKSERKIIVTGKEVKEALIPKFKSTGIKVLDEQLGGGYPEGCVVNISGTPGTGKSCLALMAIAECQRNGGTAVWVDAEPPFPYLLAMLLGVDIDTLYIIKPQDFGEQILNVIEEMLFDVDNRVTRGIVDLIVIDSVNGLIPKAKVKSQEEKGYEGNTIGTRARMMSDWLESLSGRGSLREGTVLLVISQMRTDINSYGAPMKRSGGLALEYLSKVILELRKKPLEKFGSAAAKAGKDAPPAGHSIEFKIPKNNIIGREGKGDYIVMYGVGVDESSKLVSLALENGIIVRNGRKGYKAILLDEEIELEGGIDVIRKIFREDKTLQERLDTKLKSMTLVAKEPVEPLEEEEAEEE